MLAATSRSPATPPPSMGQHGHLFLGRLVLGEYGILVADVGCVLKHTPSSSPTFSEPLSRYFSQRFSEGRGFSYRIWKYICSQRTAGASTENPQPNSET